MADRHFFAGVNSPCGFYSFFQNVADDKECKRKIYIKGGPGTGKSTLMKKVAKKAEDYGFDTEIFHCSSDPSSLDAVYIPKLKTAMIDATPPHCYDPKYIGVSGEIFNASEFLSFEKLHENSEDIIHFSDYKGRAFEKAYNFLGAAQAVIKDISLMHKNNMYLHGIDLEAEKLSNALLPKITMPKSGKVRKLFLSAIGPDGFENFTESSFKGTKVFTVKGGYGASELLKKVMETSLTRGFSVEAFYCPLFPGEKLEHLIIPDINVSFTTYNFYHHFSGDEVIDLDEYSGESVGRGEEAWNSAVALLRQAIAAVSDAGAAHSFLESFYIPAMDFDAFDKKTNLLVESIF